MTTTTTFAKAGDSTTAQGSAWPSSVDAPDLVDIGGVAVSGATSAEVLAKVKPLDVDVLVMMLGINDIRDGGTRAATKANLQAIAAKVGARHVLLCAIAPSDVTDYGSAHLDRRTLGYALNRDLSQLAADEGWLFADPWSSVRQLSNGWAKGAAVDDGVHPTAATSATYIAPRMETYIRQAAAGASA